MVMLDLPGQVKEVERDSEWLDTIVALELTEIVKEAERRSELDNVKTAHWLYRVPMAGVRYYAYED